MLIYSHPVCPCYSTYRPHSRYSHDTSGGGASSADHTHSSTTTSGFHSKSKAESRSRHSRHHGQHRHTTSHHHHSNSYHHTSNFTDEEETPVKRPRLMDISKKASVQGDGDAVVNSSGGQHMESSASNTWVSAQSRKYLRTWSRGQNWAP